MWDMCGLIRERWHEIIQHKHVHLLTMFFDKVTKMVEEGNVVDMLYMDFGLMRYNIRGLSSRLIALK